MAVTYSEFDTFADRVVASVKQKILASSDWSHLQLTTGTQNTTLASGASIGATSISTNATIPSGSYIVIGNGSANPEVRLTTGVSGAGPFTVTFADALVAAYSTSAAVGVGSYVKATTTRGAQMVLNLASAAPTVSVMQVDVYRTHDGTTGVDPLTRYVYYSRAGTGTASTKPLHCVVSAGKEHIYISIEGPRFGESGVDNNVSSGGSVKQYIALSDIVPYFGGDTVPAVCLLANASATWASTNSTSWVSRNQGNNASWLLARVYSLAFQNYGGSGNVTYQVQAKGDGNDYLTPFVVIEDLDGIRGRLAKFFGTGYSVVNSGADPSPVTVGLELTYSSATYKVQQVTRCDGTSNGSNSYGFGYAVNSNSTTGWQVAVPKT